MNFKDLFNSKKIKVLKEENNKLKEENNKLKEENNKLKNSFKFSHSARIKLDRRIKSAVTYIYSYKIKGAKEIIKKLKGVN